MATADPTILFLDDDLVVVDKPAGLPAVPGRAEGLQDCVWSRLSERLGVTLVVHRLDMATSGVMVFARRREAQVQLSRAFAMGAVAKRYAAWVQGDPAAALAPAEPAAGRIDLPIAADWAQRPRRRICPETGKASVTLWQRTAVDPAQARSRLVLEPLTGRTHQLRVHLAAVGHPIVGDTLYGQASTAGERMLLHAASIGFAHPADGRPVSFTAEAPF